MEVLVRTVLGVLLVAHGLVHLMWLAPRPDDPASPFRTDRSWALPEPARRPVAVAGVAVVVVGFALVGLAAWGVPGLASAWPGPALVAAAASLAVLVLFWDRQLGLGGGRRRGRRGGGPVAPRLDRTLTGRRTHETSNASTSSASAVSPRAVPSKYADQPAPSWRTTSSSWTVPSPARRSRPG